VAQICRQDGARTLELVATIWHPGDIGRRPEGTGTASPAGAYNGGMGATEMTIAIVQPAEVPLELHLEPWPLRTDEGFEQLCAANPDLRFERTAEGVILIMPPTGGGSSHRCVVIAAALHDWSVGDGRGRAFDSSAGFRLPNTAIRAPDCAWVANERLRALSAEQREDNLPLSPDFAVEVRSPSDRMAELRAKMAEYLANGTRLAWLIDPFGRTVDVCRPGRPAEVLVEPSSLSGDPELPGFTLEMAAIWRGLGGEA
jgi:Uma2 family endonuclease